MLIVLGHIEVVSNLWKVFQALLSQWVPAYFGGVAIPLA